MDIFQLIQDASRSICIIPPAINYLLPENNEFSTWQQTFKPLGGVHDQILIYFDNWIPFCFSPKHPERLLMNETLPLENSSLSFFLLNSGLWKVSLGAGVSVLWPAPTCEQQQSGPCREAFYLQYLFWTMHWRLKNTKIQRTRDCIVFQHHFETSDFINHDRNRKECFRGIKWSQLRYGMSPHKGNIPHSKSAVLFDGQCLADGPCWSKS